MKKFYSFVIALACCISAYAQVVPQDGQKYVIKNVDSGLYIALATGADSRGDSDNSSAASLQAVGTAFTFTGSTSDFTLQAENGDWLGFNPAQRAWNVNVSFETHWRVIGSESSYIIYQIGVLKGLGTDNTNAGSGIYTDKGTDKHNAWVFEEYTETGATHTVTASVDGKEALTMIGNEELGYNVTALVATGEHTVVVTFDGEETSFSFTTKDFRSDNTPYSEGFVNISYKDGQVSVEGKSVPLPLYILGLGTTNDPSNPEDVAYSTFDDGHQWVLSYNFPDTKTFSCSTTKGTSSEDWDGYNAGRFGAPTADYEMFLDESAVKDEEKIVELILGGTNNFVLTPGSWTFTFKLGTTPTLFVSEHEATAPTGISTVAGAALQGKVYDLAGRRAAVAVRGLYIQNGVKVIR